MHGVTSRLVWMAGVAVALSVSACSSSGVGDPCIPESIPCSPDPANPGQEICGFNASESYVESSSVQCRTRQCVVHQLQGNPEVLCPDGADPNAQRPDNCITADELDSKVYCSCRCDAPPDVREQGNFNFCNCPGGFTCTPVLALGGAGIRGSYCVRDDE